MITRPQSRLPAKRPPHPRWVVAATGVLTASVLSVLVLNVEPAFAAQPPVGLGTAASFAVLAGTTVTNTGPSMINGDVGVAPGSAVTGFPPGQVVNGTIHAADAVALQAQVDLTTAYIDAAGRTPFTVVTADLGGQQLAPGVYAGATLGLTGTVTLDAANDPNAVFVFESESTLITASSSVVALANGARWCNVFWRIGSSATLGSTSTFVGTAMALTTISAQTNATIEGRLLARNGEVTLDSNVITRPECDPASSSTSTTTSGTTSSTSSTTSSASTTSAGGTSAGTTTTTTGAVAGAAGADATTAALPSETANAAANSPLRFRAGGGAADASATSSVTELASTGVSARGPVLAGLAALILGGWMMLGARKVSYSGRRRG